ncbi:MAG: nucleotidyltransferase domain-containing protein [Candidatus Aenigmarchaeota archaeon]|nr:nucleotidyltransferase domain-containing protein [Candidatus Aenigmarchaeota archaeon]
MELLNKKLDNVLEQAKKDREVIAVILYGSVSRGEQRKDSDIDICLVLKEDYPKTKFTEKRLEYLKNVGVDIDIQIFQQLPLYIRKEVLKGKILISKDEDKLYELAYKTIKEFEDFRKYYYDYLNSIYERKNPIKNR